MNIEEEYKKLLNPILYYRIVGPHYHEQLMGFSRPANIFELMYLVISEENRDLWRKDFKESGNEWVFDKEVNRDTKLAEEVIPKEYISYIPLKKISNHNKPMKVTDFMSKKYPWKRLAKSIMKGFERPLIIQRLEPLGFIVVEGKHRAAAATIIEPFNPDFVLPCLIVVLNKAYTVKMWKKPHPHPLSEEGMKQFERK